MTELMSRLSNSTISETSFENFSNNVTSLDNLVKNDTFGIKTYKLVLIVASASILAFITIIMNLLLMVSFCVNKKLRNLTNHFLISMSVADFSIGMVSMPLYTTYLVLGYWPFGTLSCDLWLCMDYGMSQVSALHLLLICMDRFFSVKKPLKYRAIRTHSKVVTTIAGSWIISVLVWIPWIFVMPYVEGGRTVPETECYIQFLASNSYVTLITHVIGFWLPVSIMVTLYFRVYTTVQKHKRFKSHNAHQTHAGSPYIIENSNTLNQLELNDPSLNFNRYRREFHKNGTSSNVTTQNRIDRSNQSENNKAAKTLSAILFAFILTWMPYHINVTISCFCADCVPNGLYHFGYWFCYINSTVNPFLYALCNGDFRKTFLKILSCNVKKHTEEQYSLKQQHSPKDLN